MDDAFRAAMHGGGGIGSVHALPRGFRQVDFHPLVVYVVVDGARGIGASAHAGNEVVGVVAPHFLPQLTLQLLGDDALQTGHNVGIGMRSHGAAHQVEGIPRMAAPVPDGLRAGITQRHVARGDGVDCRSQHAHALHVGVLSLHVGLAHEYLASHAHQGAYRGRGHAVLSRSRLGRDAGLAHALGHEYLSYGVVNLVGARVVEVFPLQVEPAAVKLAHAAGMVERRGTAHVVAQQRPVLPPEVGAVQYLAVDAPQVVHAAVEYLGDIGPAKLTEKSFVGYLVFHVFNGLTRQTISLGPCRGLPPAAAGRRTCCR